MKIAQYEKWTCLQSTDPVIRESCEQLIASYRPGSSLPWLTFTEMRAARGREWGAIPKLQQQTQLGGVRYWTALHHSAPRARLRASTFGR